MKKMFISLAFIVACIGCEKKTRPASQPPVANQTPPPNPAPPPANPKPKPAPDKTTGDEITVDQTVEITEIVRSSCKGCADTVHGKTCKLFEGKPVVVVWVNPEPYLMSTDWVHITSLTYDDNEETYYATKWERMSKSDLDQDVEEDDQ